MVETLLKKAQEHLDTAVDAESNQECKTARHHYLIAAKLLYDTAKNSHGQLKLLRIKNAEKLQQKAESIDIDAERKEANIKTIIPERQTAEDKIDSTSLIVTKKLDISFRDVAGLENVKEEIKLKLIYPFEHREEAKRFGLKSGGGILLYGPPGTGKTHIARALAGEVNADFFSVKPSDLMDQYVGNTEKKIAEMFKTARECERAVIFIDEIESLMPKRHGQSSTVMARVVPQFLAELDGLESSNENILFLGATNEPWSLDLAALRPGRFDEKIYVPLPDLEARRKIFELKFANKPISSAIDFDSLAELTENYSGADISYVCERAAVIPFKESIETGVEREITLNDVMQAIMLVTPSTDLNSLASYKDYFKQHTNIKITVVKNASIQVDKKKGLVQKPGVFKKAAISPHLYDPTDIRNLIIQEPSYTFDNVAGMNDIKQEIKNILDEVLKYPDVYREHFGKTPAGAAILLYGVPGCGKTFIAKAAAGEFRDFATFIYVKPSDVKISKYTHIKLQRIKDIFNMATKYAPSIVLWDEIEGLLWARDKTGVPTWSRELVPEFLTLFQGAEESDNVVLHIATTNFPWVIDMAMLRSGRFSKKIFVSTPDYEARLALFNLETSNMKLADDVDMKILAKITDGVTGADVSEIVKQAMDIPWNEWSQNKVGNGPRETNISDFLQVAEGFYSGSFVSYLNMARKELTKFADATAHFPELVEEINKRI